MKFMATKARFPKDIKMIRSLKKLKDREKLLRTLRKQMSKLKI